MAAPNRSTDAEEHPLFRRRRTVDAKGAAGGGLTDAERRQAMLNSPNPFVAREAGCVGHEGLCTGVGLAPLGAGGFLELAGSAIGRLTLWGFGIGMAANSDVPLPIGGGFAAVEEQTLFRGVASDSPAFANAQLGIAVPRGGAASTLEHSLGNTESNFTSWTSEHSTAVQFATNKGMTSGVVLTKTFPRGFAIPAAPSIEEIMMESEHLVPSRVTGAAVTPVR